MAGTVDLHFASRLKSVSKIAESIELFTAVFGGQYYRDWAYDTELFQILTELKSQFANKESYDVIIDIYFDFFIYLLVNSRRKMAGYF